MKKLLLTLLLPLSIISSASYGEELNSLFGITLYENAEKYVSSNYINSNKVKNTETIKDYFDLNFIDKIKEKSSYVSDYWIVIDNNNSIHQIYGQREYTNLSTCQSILETLSSSLEERYEIDFEYWNPTFPDFEVFSYYHHTSSKNYFAIQCNKEHYKSSVLLQIYIDSRRLFNKKKEFYDSGL